MLYFIFDGDTLGAFLLAHNQFLVSLVLGAQLAPILQDIGVKKNRMKRPKPEPRPRPWRRHPARVHLYIQFSYLQSVALDELPSWLHFVSHKDGKNRIGFNRILYSYLEQGAFLGAHGGLP